MRCGHYGRDGAPLAQSPDTIVHKAYQRLRAETGVELQALGEIEYFLGKRPDESDIYGATERGYHAARRSSSASRFDASRWWCSPRLGSPSSTATARWATSKPDDADARIWEQHEIELALQPLPDAADCMLIAQWVLRMLANKAGWRCSTEPMMLAGHAGNGLHVHLSRSGRKAPCRLHSRRRPRVARPACSSEVSFARAEPSWRSGIAPLRSSACRQRRKRPSATLGTLQPVRAGAHADRCRRSERTSVAEPPSSSASRTARPMAHLLLAGIVQAMIAAGGERDLPGLIDATSAVTKTGSTAKPVPRSFPEVAERSLGEVRATFEAAGIFPAHVIDRTIDALGQM